MSSPNSKKRKQAKRKARERAKAKAKARRRGDEAAIAMRRQLGFVPSDAQLEEAVREVLEEGGVEVGDEDLSPLIEKVKVGAAGRSAVRRRLEKDEGHVLDAERDTLYPGLAERIAAEGWAETDEPVYLRFGLPPEGGYSGVGIPGVQEAGVSVFAGRLTKGGHYVVSHPTNWARVEFARLCGRDRREAYFVKGPLAEGLGGAEDPLLAGVDSVEPVPDDCVIAFPGGSRSLDEHNERNFGGPLGAVPGLRKYFEEESDMIKVQRWALAEVGSDLTFEEFMEMMENGAADKEPPDGEPVYLRFGDAPAGGRSLAAPNGLREGEPRTEKGVSVFRAYRTADGEYVVDTSASGALAQMFRNVAAQGRAVYLAEGEEIARGSDGEPVLREVTLTPLPEGTVYRSSGHYEDLLDMFYKMADIINEAAGDELAVYPGVRELPKTLRAGPAKTPAACTTPAKDPAEVLDRVLARSTNTSSALHGPPHWRAVAVAGKKIVEETPEADPIIVLLFAILHDSMRLHDGADTWHGWRAGKLASELLAGEALLSVEDLETLVYALEHHDEGEVSDDPTVGACWDADRLNLWRIGVRPDPAFLSTAAAPGLIEWGRKLQHEHLTWEEIMEATEGART